MFGAPDLPRRPAKPAPRESRRPGVGDHVDLRGGYLGLIVDISEKGRAIVASRDMDGRIGESAFDVRVLTISETIPLGLDERVDRDWKRGALG